MLVLETCMDSDSQQPHSLFSDLGGFRRAVERLDRETAREIACAESNPGHQATYEAQQLLRYSLRLVVIATYSQGTTTVRPLAEPDLRCFYASLIRIFRHPAVFGGELVATAAAAMSDYIHEDPLCFRLMLEVGLPQAFLDSLREAPDPAGGSDSLVGIPQSLYAVCLNLDGLSLTRRAKPLGVLIRVVTSARYLRSLQVSPPAPARARLDRRPVDSAQPHLLLHAPPFCSSAPPTRYPSAPSAGRAGSQPGVRA